ncbi:electron transport complex subunit RsxC [Motilimonas sp. KMU-193]|uniref:electron transport complex subunit RsxC n=1 Tax=Motilimonas sp. KMU-193 TaxID=3388668 RepID=UPI00396B3392
MIQSILAHIKQGKLWRFAGGVFPSERKGLSNQQPILPALLPSELVIPLNQHIGEPADLLVQVGEQVLKGQALTRHNNFRSLPVHASTSGTVTAIEARPSCHPSGIPEISVVITPDGKDTWITRHPITDISQLDRHAIIDKIHLAGIAGKGGAGFPAHLKLSGKADIELLIINGIECEPYITSDDMLMREYANELIQGIAIIERITQCKQTVIAIESNKPEAIAALSEFNSEHRRVTVVPTKYPSGGEKQLIELITGKQVPNKGYPIDMGILMHNVGTAYAIKRAVIDDEPLISRIVTITGEAFEQRGNVHALIGTPIEQLIAPFNLQPQANQTRLIIGGPMMGFTLPDSSAPVIKTTNCILAPTEQELPSPGQEMACIRCGECADACPASLLPQQLYWYAKANDHEKLHEYNLFDCIECGSCAYVCPSEIPLVQYYRIGKADIRQQEQEAKKAEVARIRHEARQARLEREKEEREARNKAAAEKRKAQILANQEKPAAETPAKPSSKDAVAQALARAKAKRTDSSQEDDIATARKARKEQARLAKLAKQGQQQTEPEQDDAPELAQDTPPAGKTANPAVAAALARAKAKKAAQQGEQAETETNTETESADKPAPTKNPAVAAALARAKAKKAAQQGEQAETETNTETEPAGKPAPTKNPAVAAAIARAKAKKAAQQGEQAEPQAEAETETNTETEPAGKPAPTKNPAVAAAIARAKAKKAAQQGEPAEQQAETETNTETETETKPAPTKNPAVAAAIARAKAKKAAQQGEQAEPQTQADTETNTETEPAGKPAPTKNPAVAAAIARAKAKKAAQQAQAELEQTDSQKDNS